jgi:hypothetical protein
MLQDITKDAIWVKNCVVSCKTEWQLEGCLILMQLFEQKHKDDPDMRRQYLAIQSAYLDQETFLTVEL